MNIETMRMTRAVAVGVAAATETQGGGMARGIVVDVAALRTPGTRGGVTSVAVAAAMKRMHWMRKTDKGDMEATDTGTLTMPRAIGTTDVTKGRGAETASAAVVSVTATAIAMRPPVGSRA